MVYKKDFGRVGKNGQKSSYSQAEEKERIGKKCLEETGVGGRNLHGTQADDSQNDFPFASGWQT